MKFNPRRAKNIASFVCAACFVSAGAFAAINPFHEPALKTKVKQAEEALFAAKSEKAFALSRLEAANKRLEVCLDKRDENNKPMKCDWDVSVVTTAEVAKKTVSEKENQLKQAEDAYGANIAKTAGWIISLVSTGLIACALAGMASIAHKLISISKAENKQKGNTL
jgi:hypothetical protein